MKDNFLKLMFNILKNHLSFIITYQFLPERTKIEEAEKLIATL